MFIDFWKEQDPNVQADLILEFSKELPKEESVFIYYKELNPWIQADLLCDALPPDPECVSEKTRSCYELKVEKQLESLKIRFFLEYKFAPERNFRADFYLPDLKLLIEYDSEYYHSLLGRKKADREKDRIAKSLGFRVLRIPGRSIEKKNFDIGRRIDEF